MSITPDTTNYMIAGYAVFFSIFIFFVGSLYIRWSRLSRDLHVLEDLQKED